MDAARIAALLEPFLGRDPMPASLVGQLQIYLDVLLRWNTRMNLTAVRDLEQIITRHFGESLFAARVLRDAGAFDSPSASFPILADFGAGAGFPGIPVKLVVPELELTLIESQNKKATFLREVIRTLGIHGAEVFCGRAEDWQRVADVVTLRAVEKFKNALPAAGALVAGGGTLCLLIGVAQTHSVAEALVAGWQFKPAVPIPQSSGRIVLTGSLTAQRTPKY